MEVLVSQPLVVPFSSLNQVLGKLSFPDLKILNSGVVVTSPVVTYAEIGGGLYTLSYTPITTGNYSIFIEGSVQLRFSVVTKTVQSFLRNLEDEALGSWTWNKTSNLLTLLRQDGSAMASFNMIDGLESGSRERLA